MKIRIDKEGRLFVDSKIKVCPYATWEIYNGFDYVQEQRPCGDWCALFKTEEYFLTDIHSVIKIELCHGKNWAAEKRDFTDERPKP